MTARIAAYRRTGFIAVFCAASIMAACSSSNGPTNSDPIASVFQCGRTDVEARFMNRRMALFVDGLAYALQQADSASGARYTGSDGPRKIEFWNKGDEATLTIGDQTYPTCLQK